MLRFIHLTKLSLYRRWEVTFTPYNYKYIWRKIILKYLSFEGFSCQFSSYYVTKVS